MIRVSLKYKNKWLQRVGVVIALFVLASCGSDLGCVAADDWGYPKITVPSHYDQEDVKGDGISSMQVVEPIDSGQVIIDAAQTPIVIAIGDDSQWTSWFGGDSTPEELKDVTDSLPWKPLDMVPNTECQYSVRSGRVTYNNTPGYDVEVHDAQQRDNNDLSPKVLKARRYKGDIHEAGQEFPCPAPGVIVKNPDMYADCRVPCYMRHGMGLYVGFSHDATADGVVIARHIPDAQYPEVPYNIRRTDPENRGTPQVDASGKLIVNANGSIDYGQGRDGYLLRGFPNTEIPGVMTGDRLFFKIVDTLYTDNYGSYRVDLKEGTRSPKEGPIESVVNIFLTPIMQVMERLWKGLTTNNDFITFVRACMELFIVFYALSYMMGMISSPKKEFIVNLIRLALVVQLIGPNSYDFFYNHFFAAFLKGIAEIIGFIVTPFTDYDPKSPWYSLDQLLHKLWSAETHAKLWATLFSNAVGLLFIIGFYFGLVLFLIAVVKAVLNYIAAMVILAILVVVGPIFIILMLYGKTRELFDEWVSQFIAVAIELLILFAALGMFAYIIVFFMEQSLGFRACWNTVFKFDILDTTLIDFKFWMPDIRYDSEHFGPIWMDANNDGFRGINEFANRYFDLPYLDIVHDRAKLVKFASEKNFLTITDILLFVGIIFLMQFFLEYVPQLANALKGASGNASSSIAGAGATMYKSFLNATIGRELSDKEQKELLENKDTWGVGKKYYGVMKRDGGLLAGSVRGIASLGGSVSSGYNRGHAGLLNIVFGTSKERKKVAGKMLKGGSKAIDKLGGKIFSNSDRETDSGNTQSLRSPTHASELMQDRLNEEKKQKELSDERAKIQGAQAEKAKIEGAQAEQARITGVQNVKAMAEQDLVRKQQEREAANRARIDQANRERIERERSDAAAAGKSIKDQLMQNTAVAGLVKGMNPADLNSLFKGKDISSMSQAEIRETLEKKGKGDEGKARASIRPTPPPK